MIFANPVLTRGRLKGMLNAVSTACLAAAALAFAACAAPTAGPTSSDSSAKPKPGTSATAAPGFAVVELFSSEGCSSCPPADDVLAHVHAQAKKEGRAVYTLAFHVDYWDHLGWKDRFATPEYTQRQRDYAFNLKTLSLYTPQMIVNGTSEFVGSKRARAESDIAAALKTTAPVAVAATLAARKAGEPFVVDASALTAPAGTRLCAALAEDGLVSQVKAGENSGSTLKHEGVVRAYAAAAPDAKHAARLTLKPSATIDEAKSTVVVFVQDEKTMRILGATAIPAQGTSSPTAPTSAPTTAAGGVTPAKP
ncbi:hypothetical protein BH11PLA1_BH11PLA1_05770 [soil metagenome]